MRGCIACVAGANEGRESQGSQAECASVGDVNVAVGRAGRAGARRMQDLDSVRRTSIVLYRTVVVVSGYLGWISS